MRRLTSRPVGMFGVRAATGLTMRQLQIASKVSNLGLCAPFSMFQADFWLIFALEASSLVDRSNSTQADLRLALAVAVSVFTVIFSLYGVVYYHMSKKLQGIFPDFGSYFVLGCGLVSSGGVLSCQPL